jgi:FAD/FMN-containing dehydrogenase/Fe-S oxidoreductase
LAVAYPKNKTDIKQLIQFATENNVTLIPRTAGTSLAGQCVGEGIVVDVSKHFTKILNFDKDKKTITVQPGVIRDELNLFLKPHGLFFSPNTSTSNRCMIGGMVGNNSSGTTSIQYGVTRDKIIKLETILSDGSEAVFSSINKQAFKQKAHGNSLEAAIYNSIFIELTSSKNQAEIKKEFPKTTIHRRNNGYAIDKLLDFELFGGTSKEINLATLLSGSEGTLAFTTEITLQLDNLPPRYAILVASHFNSIQESMKAVQIAMKHNLFMCELMDKAILDCTKNNREQAKNRFFLQGEPEAVLMLEVRANSENEVEILANQLIESLNNQNFGYAHQKVYHQDIEKVVNLRKAGLGLLGNIIGDRKAVACIEDTAVALEDLPNYIEEFTKMMADYKQDAIYYAHAGAGEIHLRPILNLKKSTDVKLFREITTSVAKLVKKYDGSFSGEHGDGIVRAEFIPILIGEKNYQLLKRIKQTFDPNNIFNKGKIIDAFEMDKSLRYKVDRKEPEIKTIQNFEDNQGVLRLAEKCNGSGDCRKPVSAGGVMCPSYRATKDEKDTTRARANALREFLTNSNKINKFDYEELATVFDLCLSCKACASECPSNVDVASLKAEFLHQYYKSNKPSFRTKLFANNNKYVKLARFTPILANFVLDLKITKRILGIAVDRKMPKIAKKPFVKWISDTENIRKKKKVEQSSKMIETNNQQVTSLPFAMTNKEKKSNDKRLKSKVQQTTKPRTNKQRSKTTLYLFIDEFTNIYDTQVGKDTYKLLTKLGYTILTVDNFESGRAYISKGFLFDAKKLANKNINLFKDLINDDIPLVGMEPSAILGFRDEYLRLADDIEIAKKLAKNTFTIEEFIANEIKKGNINASQFTKEEKTIKIHTHCHQKSLSNSQATFDMLNIPDNYTVTLFNTGCCGMAGSFGYEREHYNISMKIGENSVFPKVRNTAKEIDIAVAGTSCRSQILDGTDRETLHPVSILLKALI